MGSESTISENLLRCSSGPIFPSLGEWYSTNKSLTNVQCSPHYHYLGACWCPHHSYSSDNVPTSAQLGTQVMCMRCVCSQQEGGGGGGGDISISPPLTKTTPLPSTYYNDPTGSGIGGEFKALCMQWTHRCRVNETFHVTNGNIWYQWTHMQNTWVEVDDHGRPYNMGRCCHR